MLPAWLAAIVQVPVLTKVTVLPATVHTGVVVEVNTTERPEDVVADTAKGALPNALPVMAAKVIVWAPLDTVNDCVTWAATLKLTLPVWLAAIVQVPSATMVTVEPETVQTGEVVEVSVTARLDDAVAETVKGAVPKPLPASAAKVMVCVPLDTVNDRVTCVAAL